MGNPIFKFWMCRVTEAWYQLSEEEQNAHLAKINESLEAAGGKRIVACQTAWSSEQWQYVGVEEFPDIEAVQKHTADLEELGHFRYLESASILGTETGQS
jgi:hypothetical protein